jgi:hypothetical protein
MIETRVTAIIATGSAFSERRRLADNHHHRPDQPLGCVRLSRRQDCTNSMLSDSDSGSFHTYVEGPTRRLAQMA